MELLRLSDQSEPSHIHVSRPSRTRRLPQADVPDERADLWATCEVQASRRHDGWPLAQPPGVDL